MTTCADELTLVTSKREQKPEQHLEIAMQSGTHHVSTRAALMLDTVRRFTEAASGWLNMRLASRDALASVQAPNRKGFLRSRACQLQRFVRPQLRRSQSPMNQTYV